MVIIILYAAVLLPFTGYAQESRSFAVGFKGGTYESIAKSIDDISSLSFEIINTQGSIEIIQMVNEGKADFGIVQLDIMLDLDMRESTKTENVKFVLPLYSEELHIIADKKLKSIDDLAGSTISVGPKNSGTAGTALILLEKMDLMDKIKSMRFMDTKEGLEALEKGTIDAVFIVSGVPVELLTGEDAAFLEKFSLISFTADQYKKISKNQFHFKKSTVRPKHYSWLKENVKTLAVVSAVVVNSDIPDEVVSSIIKTVFSKKKELKKKHRKWREMDDSTICWYLQGRSYLFHKAAKKALDSAGLKCESLLEAE